MGRRPPKDLRFQAANVGVGITIENFQKTYNMMGDLDKPLRANLFKQIGHELKGITGDAQNRYNLLSDVSRGSGSGSRVKTPSGAAPAPGRRPAAKPARRGRKPALTSSGRAQSHMAKQVPRMKRSVRIGKGVGKGGRRARGVRLTPLLAYRLYTNDKYGSMFELAKVPHTASGAFMIDALNRHAGPAAPGRFMFPAVLNRQNRTTAAIARIVHDTEVEFQRRLDSGVYQVAG